MAGDIKCENVLVTSWNWLYLADFASFKPTYIPYDDPSDFSFFFDTGGRRLCYLAPEVLFCPNRSLILMLTICIGLTFVFPSILYTNCLFIDHEGTQESYGSKLFPVFLYCSVLLSCNMLYLLILKFQRFYEHGGEVQVAQDAPLLPSMDIFAVG